MRRRMNPGLFVSMLIILFVTIVCPMTASSSNDAESVVYEGDRLITKSNWQINPLSKTGRTQPILIRLANAHFDPLERILLKRNGIEEIKSYETEKHGYYIVQFDGPIKTLWKIHLTDLGADIFDYIPDFAFIIRLNPKREFNVRALPHVRWLGIYQPAYRISQTAMDKMFEEKTIEDLDGDGSNLFRVTVFSGEDLESIKIKIRMFSGIIEDAVTTKWKSTLMVNILPKKIAYLTRINGIKWIEPAPVWQFFNNESTDIMNVRTPRDTYGLYGAGQTVGVCDSGLDEGSTNPSSLHDDFEDGSGGARVQQIFTLSGATAHDAHSGHGTHVAGSVLGNGDMSGSDPSSNSFPSTCFAGIAPKAELIFQASGDDSGSLHIPSDLNTLFSQSDTAGAHLHTNSWGSAVMSMYTSSSEDVDEYSWDHRDFLILFSAGNSGIDMDGDGVIDYYSLGSPATAKNCLTVGASEGDRPSGAVYNFNWGYGWPRDYSVNPIYSDHVSDDPDGMAALSSRGPVIDGRYKPDLVAPGTNILSVRSQESGAGVLWGEYNDYYSWCGGTSMSTPLTAGTVALMREYLIDEKGFTNPSASMIKAALINSAEDITPGQYGTGSTQEIPDSPVPNNVEGWGRVNLGNGVYPAEPFDILYYDQQTTGLSTGESRQYTVDVTSSSYPLKINLVWTDYPGSTAAHGGLVNDLDLQVTDPSKGVHYPDNASQKSTVSTISYDLNSPAYISTINKRAIKFSPASYPVNVESTTFYFYNPSSTTTDIDVVVYDDDGSGGLPGTELFRKTMTYIPSDWITIGFTGVVINSGDFYIAIEKATTSQSIVVDLSNPLNRSYHFKGNKWILSGETAYIRANVRGTDYSTSFDRVNNVVGLTLANPVIGTHTIMVSGYNIANGPQPYGIVISGATENPLLVDLVSFKAYGLDQSVLLQWETATEIDNAGFHVWRAETPDGDYIRVTHYLIPAEGGATWGSVYFYEDDDVLDGRTYYYKLEDIDYSGVSTFHGTVSVSTGGYDYSPVLRRNRSLISH